MGSLNGLFAVIALVLFALSFYKYVTAAGTMWLIGWIPGMAYNSWSRAIGVMDISLIILGASCIDHFWKSDWAGRLKWIRPALMVVALLQVAEISLFFRSYNGPAILNAWS